MDLKMIFGLLGSGGYLTVLLGLAGTKLEMSASPWLVAVGLVVVTLAHTAEKMTPSTSLAASLKAAVLDELGDLLTTQQVQDNLPAPKAAAKIGGAK